MQKSKLLRLSLFLACVVFLFSACKPNQKPWTHNESWINPQYKDTKDFHGTVVKSRGAVLLCKVCHGLDLKGVSDVPGCYGCHFGPDGGRSPSGSAWEHGVSQHDKLSPEETACNSCHEFYRSYGLKPGACHDCHAVNPGQHSLGQTWLDKKSSDFHGKSTLVCSSCHDLKSKCSTCHFDASGSKSPAGSGWTHGTMPHNQLASSEATCNSCHDLNRRYGNGPAACHDCHGSPPGHVTGQAWIDPKSVQFHGNSTLACSTCHDLNSKCSTCHFDASGSKSPAGSGWTHGSSLPHNQLASSEAVCNQCHTLERSYGSGPASCHDCHGTQSHVLGDTWLNPNSAQFHGKNTLVCSSCHDLKSKCSTCHFDASGSKSPAGSIWTHGSSSPHNQLASSGAVCNQCHELDRRFGKGPAACHDCHGTQSHVLGDPWLNPNSTQFHGKSTITCSSCHNTTTDCSSCHFGASGSKSPAGSGWTHGLISHGEQLSYSTICTRCHDLERSYARGPALCHDCHRSGSGGGGGATNAGHPLGQPWLDPKSPQFHGTSTLSCNMCHYLDSKCSTCHFDASGSKSPAGSTWTHGTTPHNQLASSAAVCNQCHTLERSYGSGPASCHDCHGTQSHVLGDTWLNPNSAQFHGKSTLVCSSCHNTTTECSSCHFGATGSKIPAGSTWTHGSSLPHNQLTSSAAVCNQCHTLERSYGSGPASCHDCHSHERGQPWLDPKSAQFHGKSTLVCSSCHNTTTECSSCHFGATGSKIPAGSTWTHGSSLPHNQLTSSAAVCNQCHTLERSYGSGPASCHDCHSHERGQPWLDPKSAQFHGKSTLVCSSCHNTTTECSSCHFGATGSKIPAGSTWTHGSSLPHNQLTSSAAVCNQCHTLERSYGSGPASCHDCHSHERGQPWLDPKSAQFHGKSTLVCSSCHNTTTECSSCHFGATGSKIPAGSTWTHGSSLPHNQLTSSAAVCNQCHTLERSYGSGPASCHDCHSHERGQPWLDPKSAQFHGKSTLVCSSCHNTTTECSSCHFGATGSKIPAGSTWTHGSSLPHNQLTSSAAVCNQCHTLERSYGSGPASCHDCHSHERGQPWLDPKSAQFHGKSTLVCSSCHNTTTECSSCHFGATGSKIPAGSTWTHGSSLPHNQLTSSAAVCNQCHTLERSYGSGPASCHDCHSHERGQPWLDPKSAQFHGKSTLVCSSCHNTTTECSSCHFGATGSKIPAGSTWTHGSSLPHNQLTSSAAVCNQCHTLERSYGSGPASCHDCHGTAAPHAVPFTAHGSSAKTNLIYCQQCHAQPANGGLGSNPRFNVAIGSLSSGCESSGCHKINTAHPVSWTGPDSTSHQSALNMAAACALCHGADLSGGSGPACSLCHTAGSPLTKNNCTSCHAKPPTGTTYPDRSGAHAVHNALAGITSACTVCHAGAGSQTALHYNNVVNVSFSGYNARSGTAAYAAADQTCSNVSCHGGKKTPSWLSGSIDVAAECTACHAASGQYNSYTSGEHSKHVQDLKAACSECHDTNKLAAVHFSDLSSTAMTGAGQTIRADLNYNGSSCSFTCHLNNKGHASGMNW